MRRSTRSVEARYAIPSMAYLKHARVGLLKGSDAARDLMDSSEDLTDVVAADGQDRK